MSNKKVNPTQAFEEEQTKDKPKILTAMTVVLNNDLSFDVLPKSTINDKEYKLNPNALPDFIAHLQKINDKVNIADALGDMVKFQLEGE